MIEELKSRFGDAEVSLFKKIDDNLDLIQIHVQAVSPMTVLMTRGLSNYKMPVHEKHIGEEHTELYFCLPSYWDINEEDDPNRNWPAQWLVKLARHIQEKNGWFGHGHTIQCAKDFAPISEVMQQNHFILVNPILLEKEMAPLSVNGKNIHFLGIIPIYGDEMDYKQAKGTLKLMNRLTGKKVTEKLDDWRENVLKSRWKFRR